MFSAHKEGGINARINIQKAMQGKATLNEIVQKQSDDDERTGGAQIAERPCWVNQVEGDAEK